MAETPGKNRKSIWYGLLSAALAVVLLYYALRGVEWLRVWTTITHARWQFLLAACLTTSFAFLLRSLRWRILLNTDAHFDVATVFEATMAGYLGNSFLPARAGEFIREWQAFEQQGAPANLSIVLALAAVVALWWLRSRTTWGQALLAVGRDPAAARATGISVGRVQIYAMIAAGALAGLAATNFVMGHKHAFEEGLGRGVGFLGISAALLGRMNPFGIVAASLLLGFLSSGGLAVAQEVPKELTEMLQGVVVLAVASAGPIARRYGRAPKDVPADPARTTGVA